MNKVYNRTGSLFEHPFKRNLIDKSEYFTRVLAYIHLNPQLHGFESDFKNYIYSSYHDIIKDNETFLKKEIVLDCFGSKENFIQYHEEYKLAKEEMMLYEHDEIN